MSTRPHVGKIRTQLSPTTLTRWGLAGDYHSTRVRRRCEPHSHRLVNGVVAGVLRSPLHSLLSRDLLLLTYRGRKTGRRYTLPVSYLRTRDEVLVFSDQRWWRNLRGGAPVVLRLRSRRVHGSAEVVEDPALVVAAVRGYLDRKGIGAARRINLHLSGARDPGEARVAEAAAGHVLVRVAVEDWDRHEPLIRWAAGYHLLVRLASAGREFCMRAALLDGLNRWCQMVCVRAAVPLT